MSGAEASHGPNLQIAVNASHYGSIPADKTVQFDVWVGNLSEVPATSVTAIVTFPASFEHVSATGDVACERAGSVYTCDFGTLVANGGARTTLSLRPTASGEFERRATVSSAEEDHDVADNERAYPMTVLPSADLRMTRLPASGLVEPGYPYEFRMQVFNDGSSAATNVRFGWVHPWELTYLSHESPVGCRASSGNGYVCEVEEMPAGQSYTVTIRFRAQEPPRTWFRTYIWSDTADPDDRNNTQDDWASVEWPAFDAWQTSPSASPGSRWGAAAFADPARTETILFGGDTGVDGDPSAQTWRWNGTEWTQASPASSPPARVQPAAAWSAGGGHGVLFGGASDTAFLGDTWTWDGSTWTPFAGAGPSARVGAAMAAHGDGAVLFGGFGGPGVLDDTWIWNGSTWTKASPSVSPPARFGHSMIEDPATGTVVLFGGCCTDEGDLFADTWIWNGVTWAEAAPGASPPSRMDAAAAYDAGTNTPTIVGGWSNDGETLADAWSWKDRRWAQRSLTGTPARDGAVLVHAPDTGPGRLMLFGGADAAGDLSGETRRLRSRPAPRLASDLPAKIAFGGVLGGATVKRPFTVRNLGTARGTVSDGGVSGVEQEGVYVDKNGCGELNPGASCTMYVGFSPSTYPIGAPPRAATVTVEAADSTFTSAVTGARVTVSASTKALSTMSSTNLSFPVSWSAPGASGVVYDVEYTERTYRNYAWREGTWNRWRTGTTSTSGWFGGSGQPPSGQGKTVLFRVRARRGTEISAWSPARSTVVPLDDRSWTMKWSSGWSNVTSSGRYLGTLKQTSSAGRRMTMFYETNMLTIIGDKCSSCGAFDVYIDTVKVARVDTYSAKTLGRQVLFSKYFSKGIQRHRLEIVTAGTRGRPWVKIDGVAGAR